MSINDAAPPMSSQASAKRWPRPAASIAVFRGNRVLLVRRGRGALAGLWSLPGGHIEAGESAAAAALRELTEETGVNARLSGIADVHDVILRDGAGALTAHYVICVFSGTWLSGEPAANSECLDARFIGVEGLESLPLTDGAAAIIARAYQRLTMKMP